MVGNVPSHQVRTVGKAEYSVTFGKPALKSNRWKVVGKDRVDQFPDRVAGGILCKRDAEHNASHDQNV